jgi:hypothetical protein
MSPRCWGESPPIPVNREYDIFEMFPDGSALWRNTVTGRDEAIKRLQELSAQTANEVRLMHLPTQTVIAEMNAHADTKGH